MVFHEVVGGSSGMQLARCFDIVYKLNMWFWNHKVLLILLILMIITSYFYYYLGYYIGSEINKVTNNDFDEEIDRVSY